MSDKTHDQDDPELAALVAALIDDQAVDWDLAATTPPAGAAGLLDELRGIAAIAAANRRAQRGAPATVAPSFWGGLRLEARIGGGNFGEVYRAHDPRLQRTVALKLLDPRRSGMSGDPLAGAEEARLLARVRHRNVVVVHGVERHGGRVGIVMEFIDGETIEDILRDHGPMSPEEALVIGRDLCRAVAALHGAGILHRDIKARNVMRELGGRIVLMDLGIGCQHQDRAATTRVGTPQYAAPELLEAGRASRRSDIFALGVLLFHLVSGTYPVAGRTPREIMAAYRSGRRRRLQDLRPDLPPVFIRVVENASSADPRDRPASAGELAAELARALGGRSPARPAADRISPSIAVLPFLDLSPRGDHAYLCEGIAEQIIHALSHLRGLRVMARTSSFHYRDHRANLAEIGRQLKVTTLLDGSVRIAGERMRIAAQLVDVDRGDQLWSAQYDRPAGDVIRLEDEIARAVVARLADRLLADAQEPPPVAGTDDVQALQSYLRGRYLFNQGSREDLEAALRCFQAAVERDPGYAQAHVGIGTVCAYLFAYRHANSREQLERAGIAARRAVALAPDHAEAHACLGFVCLLEWDWEAARRSLQRARAINPDCPSANHYRAQYLQAMGRLDEAREVQERCAAADPASRFAHGWLALFRLRSGRLAEARRQPEAMSRHPECPPLLHVITGQSYVLEGRVAQGIEVLEAAVRASHGYPVLLASLGWAYGVAGRRDDALQVLSRLHESRRSERTRPYLFAKVCASLGDLDQAFAWLDRSVLERDPFLIMLRSDQTLARLRDDPRFLAILRRINLA